MATLTFSLDSPSGAQLLAYGDAALKAGHFSLAEALYSRASRDSEAAIRAVALVRLGLAQRPTSRTHAMVAAHEALIPASENTAFIGDGLATFLKTLPFYNDARFMEINERHKQLLPLSNWQWNLGTVLWAVQQVKDLDGDFVELGVFKGHTTLFVAEYLEFAAWRQKWTLYDTFDGIPDDQLDKGWREKNEVYKGTFSYEEVRDRFAAFDNIEVVKGRVPEVLAKGAPEKISFLHMDMNNATAEIAALDCLFDRIVPGGVIVFDDYMWAASRAQYEAEKAWFAARGLVVLPLPTGQGVFVKA